MENFTTFLGRAQACDPIQGVHYYFGHFVFSNFWSFLWSPHNLDFRNVLTFENRSIFDRDMAISMIGTLFQNYYFYPLKFGIWKIWKSCGGGVGGGRSQHPSQEINKRVVWDTMLLLRVWTFINKQIKCNNSGSNLKNWADFAIRKSSEIEVWPNLTNENQCKSLNFLDTGLIFWTWLSWQTCSGPSSQTS